LSKKRGQPISKEQTHRKTTIKKTPVNIVVPGFFASVTAFSALGFLLLRSVLPLHHQALGLLDSFLFHGPTLLTSDKESALAHPTVTIPERHLLSDFHIMPNFANDLLDDHFY